MKLIVGECLEELKKMDENSIDTIITDPPYGLKFMGSGTTGLACQNTGREFIGIDNDKEYVEIAKARMNANAKLF